MGSLCISPLDTSCSKGGEGGREGGRGGEGRGGEGRGGRGEIS